MVCLKGLIKGVFSASPLCWMAQTCLMYTVMDWLADILHPWQLSTVLLFSLHSSCLKSNCLNTKPCHFCPVPSLYLSVHSVPPDQQQGQCGHQPQRACSHSFSGTLSACLAACMFAWLSLTIYLSVHTFSGICPEYAAMLNSMPFSTLLMVIVVFSIKLKNHKYL